MRQTRIVRSALLGLLTYALGLIPFYFLTPVHQAVPIVLSDVENLIVPPAPVPLELVPAVLTPTPVPAKKIGADVPSVVDSASPVPVTVPSSNLVGSSRFAFLLLGYGGGTHPGAYLTDSMMVVIVDPTKKTLALLSLPRDSWVPLYVNGQTAVYNKINTAYAFAKDPTSFSDWLPRYQGDQGAGNFAADSVSRLLGIPIKYYLGLDFQGFRDMINAVGGVDVNVPDGFAARYPANDDPSINAAWMIVRFQPGPQHMDGERAIEYARARETINNPNEGTDFARSRRQRLIIEAFKTRLMQPGGLIHLPQLLSIASQHVDTNYSVPGVAQLSQLALGWKDVKIYQTALTTGNYLEDATGPEGTYIAVPGSTDHSWAQIQAFAKLLWDNPAVATAIASTTIIVENDTGVAGVAGQVSDELAALGYHVGDPITGTIQNHTDVVDHTGGQSGTVLKQLSNDLGLGPLDLTSAPSDTSGYLVLQLGTDAVDLKLNTPVDKTAPYSTVGVIKFGVWPYTPPVPTPVRVATPPRALPADKPTENGHAVVTSTLPVGAPTHVASGAPAGAPRIAETVVIPSLVGLPLVEAQQSLTKLGLVVSGVDYQIVAPTPENRPLLAIPPGAVLSQSPRSGLTVPRGEKVTLTVRR